MTKYWHFLMKSVMGEHGRRNGMSESTHITTMRLPACIDAWPDCAVGEYDPRCCRFPKSCSCDTPAWFSEPIFDAIVEELVGVQGNPFDITIEPGEARLVASRIIGRLRHIGREPVAADVPEPDYPLTESETKEVREMLSERRDAKSLLAETVKRQGTGSASHFTKMVDPYNP